MSRLRNVRKVFWFMFFFLNIAIALLNMLLLFGSITQSTIDQSWHRLFYLTLVGQNYRTVCAICRWIQKWILAQASGFVLYLFNVNTCSYAMAIVLLYICTRQIHCQFIHVPIHQPLIITDIWITGFLWTNDCLKTKILNWLNKMPYISLQNIFWQLWANPINIDLKLQVSPVSCYRYI